MIICAFGAQLGNVWDVILLIVHRFVPEGKEDLVLDMLRELASECKAEISEGK